MRRKSRLYHRLGACLLCLLCSLTSLGQPEKPPEAPLPKDGETTETGVKNSSAAIQSPYNFLTNRAESFRSTAVFWSFSKQRAASDSRRLFAPDEDFSLLRRSFTNSRRRGGGIQSLLSSAAGITPIGDFRFFDSRLPVSSNGQRPTSNNFTVDGFSANLGISLDETSLAGNAGLLPALTASGGMNSFATSSQTQEITIRTLSGAREQRVGGAEINISTRSGNNGFHGSIFEIFGSERLNANDFFANSRGVERADARLNQFGGALGGYILQRKAWFYGGYEGLRLRQPGYNLSEVPNLVSRSIGCGALCPILNAFPLSNGQETSNGFAEFAAVYTNPAAHDVFAIRIDAQPISRLRIGGRYNFADSLAKIRADRDFSLNTRRNLDTETNSFSLWTSYAAGSNIVIDGRLNFSQNFVGQQFSIDGFGGADTSGAIFNAPYDFLKFDFAGKNSALAAGNPLATNVRQFQASGTVDWFFTGNNFTFGADFRRITLDIGAAQTERNVLFSRVTQNFNLLTARVTELSRSLTEKPELNNFSLFGQNNFRIGSRLQINLGLRWDADFAPKIGTTNVSFQNASLQMPDNKSNFAPRASVAFELFQSIRAVLRGGGGLYYDFGNGAASDSFANSFPFASGAFARNAGFSAAPTAPLRPLVVFDNNLQTPRVWHAFAEYQQELFRNLVLTATFTSSTARKLFLTRTSFNADPNFNYVRITDNSAESDFRSLQIRVERRFAQGFSFNARYSLSKSKDNFSPDRLRETNFVSAGLEREGGASDFDVRHQFGVYGVYDIPTFFVGGWAESLTEDWSISAFANARTGFPLSVGYTSVNDFGKEFVRADAVPGVPVYLTPNVIKSLNPEAFTISSFNAQGNTARNALRGFPLFQLDASLQKRIRFTNEMRLELGINAYNVMNNTNFADMSGNLGTRFQNGNFLPNEYFGKTNSTYGSANFTPFYLYGGARTIQLSAKFVF